MKAITLQAVQYRHWVSGLAVWLVLSAPADASYDKKCMDLLTPVTGEQAEAFKKVRSEWTPVFKQVWKIDRAVSDTEYEALLDIMKGLSLTATFADGKTSEYAQDAGSLRRMAKYIKRGELVEVKYSPAALATLGAIFQASLPSISETRLRYLRKLSWTDIFGSAALHGHRRTGYKVVDPSSSAPECDGRNIPKDG